jgi:hypothetical protein
MGNCCCTKETLTDNDAENLIRESILLLNTQKLEFEELDEKISEIIGISLIEIHPTDTIKWITRDKYLQILNNILINDKFDDTMDFSTLQKLACLSYEDINFSNNTSQSNNFLLWVLANVHYINNSKTRLEKVKLVEKIILNSDKMLTFKTFKKFLTNYLMVNLLYITQNFRQCAEGPMENDKENLHRDFRYLIDDIFNLENVISYINELIGKMKDKILRNSVSFAKVNFSEEPASSTESFVLKTSESNEKLFSSSISNEFLKRSHLQKFFNENFYLLNIIELRDNFFNTFNVKSARYLTTV